MKLLKYTNTTNPQAPIAGHVLLTDEEAQTLIVKREEIKAQITGSKKFVSRVGEGFILFNSADDMESTISIVDITDIEVVMLQQLGITETGFARFFKDGILTYQEDSFISIIDETEV